MLTFLLFPITHPKQDLVNLLASLGWSKVALLAPVPQEDPAVNGAPSLEADILTPSVSQEVKEKVERLSRDLKNWASALGLGQDLSAGQLLDIMRRYEDESVQEIVDLLKDKSNEDHLLNALLLLSLSHRADAEQDMLDREVRKLAEEQRKLQAILQGTGKEEGQTGRLQPIEPLGTMRERLKAWAIALSLVEADLSNTVPLGETIGVKDLIETEAERRLKRRVAQDIAEFPVPSDMPARGSEFRPLAARLMDALTDGIGAGSGGGWRNEVEAVAAEWSGRLTGPPPVMKLVLSLYDSPLSDHLSLLLPEDWGGSLSTLPNLALYLV